MDLGLLVDLELAKPGDLAFKYGERILLISALKSCHANNLESSCLIMTEATHIKSSKNLMTPD